MERIKFNCHNLKLLSTSIEAADIYEYRFLVDMIETHTGISIDSSNDLTDSQINTLQEFENKNRELLVSIIISNKRRGLFYLLTYFGSRISFNRILGLLIISFGCGYIFYVTVNPLPENNIRFVDTVLGFVLGTMLSTVINFYFGSSTAPKNRKNNEHSNL